jgi:hypothetical protein
VTGTGKHVLAKAGKLTPKKNGSEAMVKDDTERLDRNGFRFELKTKN